MSDIAIEDLFMSPEERMKEEQEAKESTLVPTSFSSVEKASDWFRDRGVYIIDSYRDKNGTMHVDGQRVRDDGHLAMWSTIVGKDHSIGEDDMVEESDEEIGRSIESAVIVDDEKVLGEEIEDIQEELF